LFFYLLPQLPPKAFSVAFRGAQRAERADFTGTAVHLFYPQHRSGAKNRVRSGCCGPTEGLVAFRGAQRAERADFTGVAVLK